MHLSISDFQSTDYQASTMSSRQKSPAGSFFRGYGGSTAALDQLSSPTASSASAVGQRSHTETRLLSELWLTSAATFRRMGKVDEAHRAVTEAETLDETNPNVWVQVCPFFFDDLELI